MPRTRTAPEVLAQQGDLVVERDPLRASGRLLLQDGMEASYVDLAHPSHLEFDYMRWMRIVLRAARARRVIHVGGAACALARALAAEDPGGLQQVCEIDPEVLTLAREHLGLRRAPGLRVRVAEGRAFVAREPAGGWDAVAIDAFVAATVPRRLITVQALSDVARVAPLALVNVLDDRSAREVHLVAAALSVGFPRVWALGGRTGNTIVVGSAGRLELQAIAARAAADPSPARLTGPKAMALEVAGTHPLRDEDVEEAANAV
jgi:lambda repressor-like predicted transcriptional regulator